MPLLESIASLVTAQQVLRSVYNSKSFRAVLSIKTTAAYYSLTSKFETLEISVFNTDIFQKQAKYHKEGK